MLSVMISPRIYNTQDVVDAWKLAVVTVRVENFAVVLISRFSWVAHHTKFIHVEGGINTREIF